MNLSVFIRITNLSIITGILHDVNIIVMTTSIVDMNEYIYINIFIHILILHLQLHLHLPHIPSPTVHRDGKRGWRRKHHL